MSHPFIDEIDLRMAEELAVTEDTAMSQWLSKCVSEVRRLQHELNDPNYSYSGRIHRQAILCRNAEIDRLQKRIKELEEGQK